MVSALDLILVPAVRSVVAAVDSPAAVAEAAVVVATHAAGNIKTHFV
jgi:hypothetical protein